MAVMRLKALRGADHEFSEEEESRLPGCPWAINHQLANYCFFSYLASFLQENNPPSHTEVAHMLNISTETVKRIEKDAINKGRSYKPFKDLIDNNDGESIIEDVSHDAYEIIR